MSEDKGWLMLIRNFRQGRIFFARLDHGEDIISQITDLVEENGIRTGALSAIGALSRTELGYYDQLSHEYCQISLEEPMELASCSGNISMRDGRPFVHAHAVLSDRTGRTWGGHLTSGTIFAAELYLQELSGLPLKRVPDSITGLTLWGEE